jgi:hypothetical protein
MIGKQGVASSLLALGLPCKERQRRRRDGTARSFDDGGTTYVHFKVNRLVERRW